MKPTIAFLAGPVMGFVALSLIGTPIAEAKVVKTKAKGTYRITISAIPGADEKSFADSASRCMTKAMKTLHALTVKQLEKDIAQYGADRDAAVETYKNKVELTWSAMEQPYCGFGSNGMAAVKHSYNKSIGHARAEFLAAVK